MIYRCMILSVLGLPWLGIPTPGQGAEPVQPVNFVGCASEGMSGPAPAPQDDGKSPRLPADMASALSYYVSAGDLAVLAPAGWQCQQIYGSNGAELFIMPTRQPTANLYGDQPALNGPVVELQWINGFTSGREDVARIAARLFPARPDLVRSAREEEPDFTMVFPHGPYLTDTVIRHGPADVEYCTPAGRQGMGTDSRLGRDNTAIHGAALMTVDGNLVKIDVRLPQGSEALAQTIIDQVRKKVHAVPAVSRSR